MSNEQHNEREAAMYAYLDAEREDGNVEPVTFGYDLGFRDGAASVDRVEVVREAFKDLTLRLGVYYSEGMRMPIFTIKGEMDAVLAAMEKGK